MNRFLNITVLFLLFSTVCWAQGTSKKDAKSSQQAQQKAAQEQTQAQSVSQYWTGDGGKGKSITILPPDGIGLAKNQEYLLKFIANELVNNFRNYSAMILFDRISNDKQYGELLSGIYDENDKASMDLGHLASTDYMLMGNITKNLTGYALHLTVIGNSDKKTVATYSEIVSIVELDNLIGVRRASLDLLQKLGITLTAKAKEELARPAVSNEAAKNALANMDAAKTEFEKSYYTYQAAMLDPSSVEAAKRLAAYQTEIYKAPEISLAMPDIKTPEIKVPQFNAPEIKMAATGNIGADARKQVEQYNAQKEASRQRQESGNKAVKEMQDAFLNQFKIQSQAVAKQQADLLKQRDKLLEQQKTLLTRQRQTITQLRNTENSYDTFFTEHPPFEIIYDPEVKPVGIANLEKGTIDMQFKITTVGTQAMEVIPLMLADFGKGLASITQGLKDINAELDKVQLLLDQVEAAGRDALTRLINDYAAQVAKVDAAENNYAAQLARLDAELKTDGYAKLGRDYAVQTDAGYARRLAEQYAVKPTNYNAAKDKTLGDTYTLAKWNKDWSKTFTVEARLENDKRKTICTATIVLTNRALAEAYTQPMSDNGRSCVFNNVPVNDITDALKVVIQRVNDRNVTIAANAGYIKISSLEADGYTKDGWDIDGYDKYGYTIYGWNKDGYDRYGYYKDGYNKDGYNKDGYDRYGYYKDGYNKDGYNRYGYDKNGRDRMGKTRMEVVKENARQAANDKFLKSSGLNFIGWGGGGTTGEAGGGTEIEFRIFNWVGLQTGIDFTTNGIQLPVLARFNLKIIGYWQVAFIYLSPYAGIGINFSSNSPNAGIGINSSSNTPINPIFGVEIGLTLVQFTVFGGCRGQYSDVFAFTFYGGIAISMPFRRY